MQVTSSLKIDRPVIVYALFSLHVGNVNISSRYWPLFRKRNTGNWFWKLSLKFCITRFSLSVYVYTANDTGDICRSCSERFSDSTWLGRLADIGFSGFATVVCFLFHDCGSDLCGWSSNLDHFFQSTLHRQRYRRELFIKVNRCHNFCKVNKNVISTSAADRCYLKILENGSNSGAFDYRWANQKVLGHVQWGISISKKRQSS